MSKLKAGIDIGGTQIKGVLMNEGVITLKEIRDTRDGSDWQSEVKRMWDKLSSMQSTVINHLGLSAPGIASPDHRSISFLPNRLEGLEGFIWSDYLGVETLVLNDAQAALLAEVDRGAGVGYRHVCLITLGTGVGGGLLIEGKLHDGFMQRGGHVGHICVDVHGDRPSIAGMPGSLEDAIGEASLDARSLGHFQKTISLVDSYKKGEIWASHIWLESVRKLALAIVSMINSVSPEVVILGGGIAKSGSSLLTPLRAFLDVYEWRPRDIATPIVIAEFGEFAGAIGAALYERF